jgi:crotonobetaine/carnitine-CoA ligase
MTRMLTADMPHPFTGTDVAHVVAERGRTRGDHPFLIWEPFTGEAETWSYARFAEDVTRLAAGLKARGVRVGDRVLIHLDNSPECVLAWYACAHLGAVAVTTNTRSVADELSYFIDFAEVVGAITQPKFAGLVKECGPNLGWIAVTETDGGEAPEAAAAGFDTFLSLYGNAKDAPLRAPDPLLPVGIQYTSGTTSRPKGVVWTHANALWGGKMCAIHEWLNEDDVHLCYLPLFHTNAQSYSVLASLWVGGTCVIQPRFSASRFWDVSLRHQCTWTSMVPFCVRALGAQPLPEKHFYRFWGNGVANPPWDPHFGIKTIGWWGMTETITQGIVSDPHEETPSLSIGKPSPAYEVAVVDDDGAPVAPGETGNLLIKGIRGLSLFVEYLKNPQATEESFDAKGFFITGDRVTLLPSGDLQFADRDKDMLKVGGENVAASEIERVIMTVEGIQECAVVAKRDEMLDEVPVAFLLVPGGEEAAREGLADEVLATCRAKLADFKVPREVRILGEFPRSTLEKIAKAQLRELL